MFGHQSDNQKDDNQIPDHSIDGALNAEHDSNHSEHQENTNENSENTDNSGQQEHHDVQPQSDANDSPGTPDFQHPGTPLNEHVEENNQPEPEVIKPDIAPPEGFNPASDHHTPIGPNNHSDTSPDDLLDIKQKALGQLTPLVGHLDQSPEDKFRTTMMMIQASDDKSLIQTAYDAAQKIDNEKVRAQALLDIVNEINYFTQNHNN